MRGWLRCFNAWDLMASFVIHISDSKLHNVNVLDMLLPRVGVFCFKDRVYMDLERLFETGSESIRFNLILSIQ